MPMTYRVEDTCSYIECDSVIKLSDGRYAVAKHNTIELPKIHVKDKSQLVTSDERPFTIVGTSGGHVFWDSYPEYYYRYEGLAQLKKDGFNTYKYLFALEQVYDLETSTFKQEGLDKLKLIQEKCEMLGLYCIFEMHTFKIGTLHFMDTGNYCCFSDTGITYGDVIKTVWKRVISEIGNKSNVLAWSVLNEPAILIHSEEGKSTGLSNYRAFVDELISEVRTVDPDTIIIVQDTNEFRNASYEFVDFASTNTTLVGLTSSFNNILLDLVHHYPTGAFSAGDIFTRMRDENSTLGSTAWKNSADMSTNGNMTFNLEYSNTTGKFVLIDNLYVSNFDAIGSTITPESLELYLKSEETGDYEQILSVDTSSEDTIIQAFKLKDVLNKPVSITKAYHNVYLWSEYVGRQVILAPNESIKITARVTASGTIPDTAVTHMTISYASFDNIKGNPNQIAVTEYKEMLQSIANKALLLESPIFMGEYCLNDKYINKYYTYEEFSKVFYEFCQKYNVNRSWHGAIERFYSGYGCYFGMTITEANRQASMWNGIMQRFLSQDGCYIEQ